ncbi:MAG: GGDEF-domain containing protein [Thiobacillus sp. 63-78]|uniref:putative bifunctional diguanylate cyclase/phosphodiesterase n=1 Tax=Thiobacillus sp. 63-78 TaxID=1895859 RepID=UPI000964AE5F|nr:EAL domain-containing protein [Thiobacillus sp. 63-78]MBN8764100.1 EAL domain-containing protein [Thiobacillus sp.]OJZ12667.1 MAG: GGDEF-domain containing protein [Thiobacillus sp. 63-78]
MSLPAQDTHRLAGILLLSASIPLLLWQTFPANQLTLSPPVFLAFHSVMEIFAVVVAALVFFTGHGAQETLRSTRSVALGCAFLAVALFDTLHFLSYLGMPDLVSPNSPHKAILFWLCGRLAAGIGLLAYVLLPETPVTQVPASRYAWVAVLLLLGGVSWGLLASPQAIPAMYVMGEGLTPLKIALEWGVFGLYLAIAVLLYLRRRLITHCDFESLMLALLLMAAAELFFVVYVQVSSTASLLGHTYKVFAYYFLYRAIYAEAVSRPFRQMRHMLTHDDLTGLPNRTAFSERLNQSIRSGDETEPCTVMLLDLDHFQNVNDTLGHEYGDLLLVAVAGRIRATLPAPAFLARFSGDEFMILLARTTSEQARQVGQTLLDAMGREFDIGSDRLGIGVSIGIVSYPADGESASVLMRYADLALHRAKAAGRNCLRVFSHDLSEEIQRRVLLEARLKQALERKELTLHYQPKLEIRTGSLMGWEALLRWQSAELGMVNPEEFIPVAEHTGLILPIGDWVVREACRQMRVWQDAGLPVGTMAVNLSARQFRQKDLAEEVSAALRDTGLAASDLELEITESSIMDNRAVAATVLTELERLGLRIAVDDFGTGYSSLSYLKSFPIHCLKIDRSFIRDIPGDENDTAIVRTIIALAGSLGLTVVAEGVETDAQLAYLRTHHCDQAQGYLFSRPLPPDECVKLMRAGLRRAAA